MPERMNEQCKQHEAFKKEIKELKMNIKLLEIFI